MIDRAINLNILQGQFFLGPFQVDQEARLAQAPDAHEEPFNKALYSQAKADVSVGERRFRPKYNVDKKDNVPWVEPLVGPISLYKVPRFTITHVPSKVEVPNTFLQVCQGPLVLPPLPLAFYLGQTRQAYLHHESLIVLGVHL
jgi:hypothetical protein